MTLNCSHGRGGTLGPKSPKDRNYTLPVSFAGPTVPDVMRQALSEPKTKTCTDFYLPTRYVSQSKRKQRNDELKPYPIGSMYGIYANIWGILMVNVTIYTIHTDPMAMPPGQFTHRTAQHHWVQTDCHGFVWKSGSLFYPMVQQKIYMKPGCLLPNTQVSYGLSSFSPI